MNEEEQKQSINEVAQRCYNIAREHGFYDDIFDLKIEVSRSAKFQFVQDIWLSNRLMLIASELGEALEAIRDHNLSSAPKSGGLGEEIADAIIRLLDLSVHLNIDIEKAITAKLDYNETRPAKHGRQL